MTSISKNVYIDKLDDIVNEYNNTYHKNFFVLAYNPNWSQEMFVTKKVKKTVPWTYVINALNGEKLVGTFYEKELQNANQGEFRI